MVTHTKYLFSFTASSMRLKEMVLVANEMTENTGIDLVNELGNGKSATGRRILREVEKRLLNLTIEQLELLKHADLHTQKQIAFLAICKTYFFIRDFVLEVIRDKYIMYDYEISEGEYLSFFRRKCDVHPEMDELTISSEGKIKQITYKILEQAGLIDSVQTRMIQPQLLDEQLMNVIINDHPEWLKIFLFNDHDIDNLKSSI